jgi:hypothetical protein
MHEAPFKHGSEAHSSTSTSQFSPAQPAPHAHEYAVTHACAVHAPSVHIPLFLQGLLAHSSISLQLRPGAAPVLS